jgi:hypothetical protein
MIVNTRILISEILIINVQLFNAILMPDVS